jgi:transposase-like protein
MPWTETEPMKERMRFVADVERGLYTMSELCERYGISRRTGYKWLDRYEADGPTGLKDRSRAPRHCPHRTRCGDGGRDRGGAAAASELGAPQAVGVVGGTLAGARLAGRQYRRGLAQRPGVGPAASSAPALATSGSAGGGDECAQ